MAPKSKAAVAKKERGVSAKIEKTGRDSMPKDEVARMLNDLRYQASAGSKSAVEFKNQAARAMDIYRFL
eukprot:3547687-Lingulodinium_polyedra.AAC.1